MAVEIKKIIVPEDKNGWRLDAFLSLYADSRSQAEKWIKQSLVKNNNGLPLLKPSYKVKTGDSLSLAVLPVKTVPLEPYDFSVPVIFEDDHILVVNKPAGLSVHPGAGRSKNTLVNALVHKVKLSSGVDPLRPGIVHRLDKDVSGLMVLSKTDSAQDKLISMFKEKKVFRLYQALAAGVFKEKQGCIVSYIGRHPRDRKKFYSFDKSDSSSFDEKNIRAKRAVTFYKVIKSFKEKIHLVECRLETGRTHQIRVHLFSQGHPILGDNVYSFRNQRAGLLQLPAETRPFVRKLNRLALYSSVLRFSHPATGKKMNWTLAWPEDLCFLLKHIGF